MNDLDWYKRQIRVAGEARDAVERRMNENRRKAARLTSFLKIEKADNERLRQENEDLRDFKAAVLAFAVGEERKAPAEVLRSDRAKKLQPIIYAALYGLMHTGYVACVSTIVANRIDEMLAARKAAGAFPAGEGEV